MNQVIKNKLTEKQLVAANELFFGVANYPFYGGAAGGGKTWIGCVWLQQMCKAYPETKWFIGRDSLKETRQSVLVTWSKVAKDWGIEGWKYGENCITFNNGSKVDFLDLSFYPIKDPFYERFGSIEFTGGWIEEAGGTRFAAFDVLKSRVGRHLNGQYNIKPKIFITANPKKNWLYTEFWQPYRNNTLPDTHCFIQALAQHNTFLPAEYMTALNSIKDKTRRQRLLLGDFEYDTDDNSLIDSKTINDMFSNSFITGTGTKYLVVDVARKGKDKSVLAVFDGMVLIEVVTIHRSDLIELKDTMEQLILKHRISRSKVLADEGGVGGGVVDMVGCTGFVSNQRPVDTGFKMLKDECGYKLAEYAPEMYVDAQLSIEEAEAIKLELSYLKTYQQDHDTKVRIMPKEKIVAALGHSPDYLDVFIMRMYFELATGFSVGGFARK